jgi:hypothetical protein
MELHRILVELQGLLYLELLGIVDFGIGRVIVFDVEGDKT